MAQVVSIALPRNAAAAHRTGHAHPHELSRLVSEEAAIEPERSLVPAVALHGSLDQSLVVNRVDERGDRGSLLSSHD